ncbi:hypothetical protein PENTCL1PPCAC_13598, partial [Pristionchus entomophagus]
QDNDFSARQLIADFPKSMYTIFLQFLPDVDELLSLPPMEQMHIIGRGQILAKTFFQLISSHKLMHIYRESVSFNWHELKHAMKMISSDSRERTARVIVLNETMVGWLRSAGFTESTMSGAICEGFELISNRTRQQSQEDDHENDFKIRYKQCFIRVNRFAWSGEEK